MIDERLPIRFAKKFVIAESGCWEWIAKRSDGYGRYWLDGVKHPAHRVSYTWLVGPIPEGLELDHLCRNHCCVNPAHLEPVTHRVNLERGIHKGGSQHRIKTHCPRGHPYEPPHLRVWNNKRYCATCNTIKMREWRARKKAKVLLEDGL